MIRLSERQDTFLDSWVTRGHQYYSNSILVESRASKATMLVRLHKTCAVERDAMLLYSASWLIMATVKFHLIIIPVSVFSVLNDNAQSAKRLCSCADHAQCRLNAGERSGVSTYKGMNSERHQR